MIQIKDTKNMIGITIHGDYNDLKTLHRALSDYLTFYFDHQEARGAYSCYETVLGLCYDIRHAYQGDRNFESVNNNADNIMQFSSCIFEVDEKVIKKERNKYKKGNLYFNVEVLYPWAIYYLYTLQEITEDVYKSAWFENNKFGYTEYQAEHDLALIQYFVQLLWGKLRDVLPDDVMKAVWEYTRLYNHIEYYFSYPDTYIEWLCTYWINITSSAYQRRKFLPLICLELSSILDEDCDELEDIIAEGKYYKNASAESEDVSDTAEAENANDSSDDEEDERAAFENNLRQLQCSIARNTLAGLELYDEYAQTYYHHDKVPYQDMEEFLDNLISYTDEHGLFTDDSYEEWLNQELGDVDWDRLEW